MDPRKLKKLIDLVQESGISELEVTEGEEKVRIAKQLTAAPVAHQVYAAAPGRPHRTGNRRPGRRSRFGTRDAGRPCCKEPDGWHVLSCLVARRQGTLPKSGSSVKRDQNAVHRRSHEAAERNRI